ncbi:MAG TPA: VWA domain-containing protein [Bryobacteraceae bacterium]|nr:VWA domain-containing protein [Bryobacteraceae bacterium]
MKSLRIAPALLAVCALASAQFRPASPTPDAPRSPQQAPPQQQPPTPQQSPPPVFRINSNLVRVLASVRNANGELITNLDKQDFRLLDNSLEQTISVFERNTSLPLSVAVMIDTSGSTRVDLHYEEDSVLRFIPTLLAAGNPEDTFAVFSFNWRVNVESDFSRSFKRAEKALHALRGDGGTSLYDAIYLVSDNLEDREGRHVMILVTDGGDTTSYKKYQDALAAAQKSDVVIYPIVVIPIAGDAGRNTGGEHALATLAASTGGRIFYPEGFERLDAAFTDILHELRTQYLLGYYPRGVNQLPRSFHNVKVEVPNAPVRISARTGYYEP